MSRTPVDGVASANTMLGFGTWRSGYCLEAVWNAYKRNGAQDVNGAGDPTAYAAWLNTDEADRRGGDFASIPAGVPVWFGPKSSSSAGDVVISVGDGWCVATDIPGRPGVIGKIRLSDRQRQINRPYLGWSTTILDWPISFAASGGGTTPNEGDNVDVMILINGKIYALAPGFIKHCDSTAQVSEAKARGVAQVDYTGPDRLNQWVRALDFYGVPRDVLDKNGLVVNPENGQFRDGGMWSWDRVAKANTDKLLAAL